MAKPFYLEYNIEQLADASIQKLADLVVGNPVYLRRRDRKIAAIVLSVTIQLPDTLLLRVEFKDRALERRISADDNVYADYEMLDPVDHVLQMPQ